VKTTPRFIPHPKGMPPHSAIAAFPHHITTVLRPFFRDHLGEPVPEENFWTLWCKGRQTHWPSGWTPLHPD